MRKFLPEGRLINTDENTEILRCAELLTEAYHEGRILEAKAVLCDARHNLIVDLAGTFCVMRREEAAIGIAEGSVKEIAIISRVNKPVCFKIIGFERDNTGKSMPVLSRRAAQQDCTEQYISKLISGDVIDARVTHLEQFGAFADIGCGISSLIPIDTISVSRISHPRDRFYPGQDIRAVVCGIDAEGRVCLTHKELLGTWEQNAAMFNAGETVSGIVRSVESYGVFVELAPNIAGLAEVHERAKPGQLASVYIKNIIPEKMKVKLIIIDTFDEKYTYRQQKYYVDDDFISHWRYSPDCCDKIIESIFSDGY